MADFQENFSKKEDKDVYFSPPDYDNLGFSTDSEKAPSAPGEDDVFEFQGTPELLLAPAPPPYEPNYESSVLTYNPPSLVYEDIFEACIRYVKAHCCYSSRFVRQMTLTGIKNDCAFHYILETFCEKRESGMTSVPFIGQPIDGPENGPPPLPWDIDVQPPALFQDGKVNVEIPHTAFVKPCDVCVGNGRIRCNFCSGRGGSLCVSCAGRGRKSNGVCTFCVGSGRSRCFKCAGTGQVKCKKCAGRGSIKCFRMLTITWNNFTEEFMANMQNLPSKYAKKVTGNKMLFEEQKLLRPVTNAPDESVNIASRTMMERHREAFQNMLILKQRHILRSIPVTKVSYAWQEKDGEFYVYGQEKDVYFQDYPQKCCCCTLL